MTAEELAEFERSPQFLEVLARYRAKDALEGQAHATPAPGAVLDAFLPGEAVRLPTVYRLARNEGERGEVKGENRKPAEITLRPMVRADWLIFQRLNSPYYRHILELQKPEDQRQPVAFEDEEVYEAVFVFLGPPRASRELLAKGRQVFREAALGNTADLFPAWLHGDVIGAAVVETFRRGLATRVEIVPEKGAEDGPFSETRQQGQDR